MKFSERYGYKPIREIVQIDSIDEPLRNSLWSLLKIHVWDHAYCTSYTFSRAYHLFHQSNRELRALFERLWLGHLKRPLDEIDGDVWTKVFEQLRTYFFRCKWYEVYDFIEFVANNYLRHNFREAFIQSCNAALEGDDAFIVEVPELPGCMADSTTYKEAVANAQTAIREWVETAKAIGRPFLSPRDVSCMRKRTKKDRGVEAPIMV